jgi:hypothetical protein
MRRSNASRNWGPPDCTASVSSASLCIVQQRLPVLDRGGKRERRNGSTLTVEREHIVAPCRTIAEDKDLAHAIGGQVEQFVPGAAQKTGEIEVARFSSEDQPGVLVFDRPPFDDLRQVRRNSVCPRQQFIGVAADGRRDLPHLVLGRRRELVALDLR